MTEIEEFRVKLDRLERLRRLELAKANGTEPWEPHPHQIPPEGDWYLWLLLAGRGAGKTDACALYFDRYMRQHPGARGGIVAPTLGDAAEACVYGPSGLMAHNPLVRLRSRAGGTHVVWPNGSEAKLFGAYTRQDVERLRAGGNRHLYWAEELAAWRYLREAWENMELGLRLGRHPHIIGSTTPKPRPQLKALMEARDTVMTRASMYDNPKLPQVQRDRLRLRYEGTRLGRQELMGEYLEDVEGALWTYETLAEQRITAVPDGVDLARVVVGVDPSGGDEDGNDEQGIIAAGRGTDGNAYVLADRSCKLSPAGWGARACHLYDEVKADRVIAETNFGGDLVIFNVKVAAQKLGLTVATKKITASRGKVARAEPIAALYEQGRVFNIAPEHDSLAELEGQQLRWTPDSGWSPDRMDACLARGTPILTPRGEVPVEEMRVGDLVWTRSGWRRVLRAKLTEKNARTLTVTLSNGRTLRLTGDHRVWTENGWTRSDALVWGVRLSGWQSLPSRSSSGVSSTGEIPRPGNEPTGSTTTRRAAAASIRSTERSGNPTTASTRSPRVCTSTTPTATRSTTTPRTSCCSPPPSMRKSTPLRTERPAGPTSIESATWPPPGIQAPKGSRGTPSTDAEPGTTALPAPTSARAARRVSRAVTLARPSGSARDAAIAAAPTPSTATSNMSHAPSAVPSSGNPSTARSPQPVPVSVAHVSEDSEPADVFDLMIAGCPEFVAAGVIVHNCVWALTELMLIGSDGRHGSISIPRGRIPGVTARR